MDTHEICIVELDKVRPALVLTRSAARLGMRKWTVAPITSRIRGAISELPVDSVNGIDHPSVVSLDNIMTVPVEQIHKKIGFLTPAQEYQLASILLRTFGLQMDDPGVLFAYKPYE